MYRIIIILFILTIIFFITTNKHIEAFKIWDYEYPLSRWIFKDSCPIQGTIEDLNTPPRCYDGYYIPYIFNVGSYTSEVNSDS